MEKVFFNESERVIVADFGGRSGKAFIHDSENPQETAVAISLEDFLSLPDQMSEGDYIIAEDAHIGSERRPSSLSQVFVAPTLIEFYERCANNGVKLRMFPQSQTPKAIGRSGRIKDDYHDPISIYEYVRDVCGVQNLKRPPRNFNLGEVKAEAYGIKDQMNARLNYNRSFAGYEENITQFVIRHLDEFISKLKERGAEDAITYFGLDCRYKKKYTRGGVTHEAGSLRIKEVRWAQLSVIATALLHEDWDDEIGDYDGILRPRIRSGLTSKGARPELMGYKFFKKQILGQSPHHLKGGVARSNIEFFGKRSYSNSAWKVKNGYGYHEKVKGIDKVTDFSLFPKYEYDSNTGVIKGLKKAGMSDDMLSWFRFEMSSGHRKIIKAAFMALKEMVESRISRGVIVG